MNILFLCWEYPPNGSGIGRYIAETASALGAAGHSATVLTSRAEGFPGEEIAGNVQVLRKFDRSELRGSRVARLALDLAYGCRADWIEAPDHWGEGAALLKMRRRPPVVVKMHYNDVLKTTRHAQAWRSWQRATIDLACLRQWRALRAERYSLEHADILIAPCRRILDEARREGLCLPERCAVVPNPIRATDTWRNAEAERPTLLMVGRLDIGKGLAYVRAIMERLIPVFPDLRLEMAGGDAYARGLGSMRVWLEKRLGPVRSHVHLMGALSPEDLDEAYRRAWVVIVPSRWDTFPQSVLESMARRKAIAASPYGGMPEMLEGTEAVIADPASPVFVEAIKIFLANPVCRFRAGASVLERVRKVYGPGRVAAGYIDAVSSLL